MPNDLKRKDGEVVGTWDFNLCERTPGKRCPKDGTYDETQCMNCMVYWTYEEYARYEAAMRAGGIVSLDALHRGWHRFFDGDIDGTSIIPCKQCHT